MEEHGNVTMTTHEKKMEDHYEEKIFKILDQTGENLDLSQNLDQSTKQMSKHQIFYKLIVVF